MCVSIRPNKEPEVPVTSVYRGVIFVLCDILWVPRWRTESLEHQCVYLLSPGPEPSALVKVLGVFHVTVSSIPELSALGSLSIT